MDTNLSQGKPFSPRPPSKILMTDASFTGWGAHVDGLTVYGVWTDNPLPHINKLELMVFLLALRSFVTLLQGQVVAIMSDNTTAVAYINSQGGTVSRSLCKLALQLWDFCLANNIVPTATHVPGIENSLADVLSHNLTTCHKWELNDSYLTPIFHCWGRPALDAFATAINAKCGLFCSWGYAIRNQRETASYTTARTTSYMPSRHFP